MHRRTRVLVAVAALAASGTVGILIDQGGTPSQDTPICARLPRAVPAPDWLPDDLPLPPGTYVNEIIRPSDSIHRAMLTVAVSLDDFVRFVLLEWPPKGWQLGAGDREAAEAEAPFTQGDGRFGQFRARSVYCDNAHAEVLLILSRNPASR
ncbi:MAG: hypothetical protein WDA27_09805 [Actinomycetota bacterium]